MSRPDGQAPWSPLPHTVWERWALSAPKPFDDEAAEADFVHLTRCAIHRGHEMPSARALGTRWGWSADKADRLARRLRQPGDPMPSRSRAEVVRRSCGGDAEVVRRSDAQNVEPIAPDCGGGAEVVRKSCGGGAETVAENGPVQGVLLAPKNQEEKNQEEHTSKPAKAGGLSLEDIQSMLDEMHAIAKAVDPRARLQSAEELAPAVMRTLKDLAPIAKSRKTTTRALIIDIWQWWWNGDNPWYRENRRAGVGYTTLFRPANARKYLTESKGWHAARYIPTADEALDAVLEVGCSEAEARYPAAARAIRQAFDFEMYGDLARMRAPKDPQKMRAAWASGFTRYLSPPPALSLVSR